MNNFKFMDSWQALMWAGRGCIFVALIAVLVSPASVLAANNGFTQMRPRAAPLVSPSGAYELVEIDFDNVPEGSPTHKLILKTMGDGHLVWTHPYRRHVDASWSNAGDVLVINDYVGSNYAECILLTLDGYTVKQRNLMPELLKTHPELHLTDYIHVYAVASKWLTDHTLLVNVEAWASLTRPGFLNKQFKFDIRDGFEP
jgi:uncharacterized protein YbaA (DUF1428 family)